jgi:hypothetical protein
MAALKNFNSLESKGTFFSPNDFYIIDTKEQFDSWFERYNPDNKYGNRINYIYRGMTDASYRLYTSAQRVWISNDMSEWVNGGYFGYISELLRQAKKNVLLAKVFDVYDYDSDEREMPLLSILQHYGTPTPLMDWTYNINVALFFATENVKTGLGTGKIENYFSIYFVNKSKHEQFFFNSFKVEKKKHPSLQKIKQNKAIYNNDILYYISDFEIATYNKNTGSRFKVNERDPVTTIYNQNIIPQEGLFIFNPDADRPIDDFFKNGDDTNSSNLLNLPFACFNIKKDLADYVRRRIKNTVKIDKSFIYPALREEAKEINEKTLYKLSS